MAYKISFKGDRGPETISENQGQALYNDFQSGELPERVEIRRGLTVESRSIRDIEHITDPYVNATQYTKVDMERFEATELKPFLNDHFQLTPAKELAFLVAKNLIEVIMHSDEYRTASDATLYIKSARVAEYTAMVEKLEQWKTHAARRDYAFKKREEELEAIAQQQSYAEQN